MKYLTRFILIVLVVVAVSMVLISGQGNNSGNKLTLKNVEALAEGETGWENCVEIRGYCKNREGTIYTNLLNEMN